MENGTTTGRDDIVIENVDIYLTDYNSYESTVK